MATQSCTIAIFALKCRIPLFNALFSVTLENITTNHILLKTGFFGLHFSHRQYGYNFNHSDIIGPHFGEITATVLFKVTNFSTNGKPVCDFLRVNNSNLPPIVHHFRDMADYWSNFVPYIRYREIWP